MIGACLKIDSLRLLHCLDVMIVSSVIHVDL